jgi:mersacidin/lichenicidin family type 2 lantibiotic
MSNNETIRAWKDEDFRNSLSDEQRSQLQENPAGMIELTEADMESLGGGRKESKKGICRTVGVTGGKKCSKKGSCESCQ